MQRLQLYLLYYIFLLFKYLVVFYSQQKWHNYNEPYFVMCNGYSKKHLHKNPYKLLL